MDNQLSPHFFLSEFTASQTASRLGKPIVATPEVEAALKDLCMHVLEPIREHFGRVVVSSGYRPEWLNATLPGTADKSQHMLGQAADFTCPGCTVEEVTRWISNNVYLVPFDQLIWEFDAWTHVSYGPRDRRQVLTAKHETPEAASRTIYLNGLIPFTA